MATGTKLMKEINDQFLICKICFEPYKDPKTLVCLHTFCCECIQKHTEAENSRPSRYNLYSRYVGCPLCRKKTEIPSGGIRNLQDNFLVSSLTEVINKRVCTKVPPCEICHTIRPRSNEACSKCLECNKLLCAGCVELHMTTKVTQKHSLIDIEGEKDIECKAHPEEIVRFYCEPCDACICVVCTFQEHRDHEICSFNEGFTKYKETLVDLLDKCKERLDGVSDRVKLIDKYELLMKEIRERIRDIAIDYMTQVRAKERELIKKVDDLFGPSLNEFIQNKSWLQENLDNLQSTCNLTEIIMKDKGVEMMLLKRELQAKFTHLFDAKLPDIPDDLPEDVRFIPGDVKLGHISINGDDDGTNCEMKKVCEGTTQSTQTVIKEFSNSTTSMSTDMKNSMKCRGNQTETLPTSNRETNTLRIDLRDRGSNAFEIDTKTKGTMTPLPDTRTQKNQTDKVVMSDQSCMTSVPLNNGTNSISANNDLNSSSSRQSRWIRSRKIQTEISAIGNNNDDIEFRNGTLMNGDDSINGHVEDNYSREKRRRHDREEITPLRSSSVPKMVDKETSPDKILQKDQCIMVLPTTAIIETQTSLITTKDSSSATDYEGQQHKSVSTIKVSCVDSASGTPQITSDSKLTWTEPTMTSDRSVCTVNPVLKESTTSTESTKQDTRGIQVRPKQRTVATNMRPCKTAIGQSQTDVPFKETQVTNDSIGDVQTKRVKLENACVGTENLEAMMKSIDRLSFHCMESSTETLDVRTCDKETGTTNIKTVDNWTLTNKPQYIDTGVSPPTPATFDAGVSTNAVITVEQSTYTDVKTYKETGVATVFVSAETETMTDIVHTSEAQTSVDIQTQDTYMATDDVQMVDEITMAELCVCKDIGETQNKETQCGHSRLGDNSIVNSSLDTSFSNSQSDILECVRCEQLLNEEKSFMDSGTMPHKQETQEVGTMALSIYGNSPDVVDADTQTTVISTKDKCVSATFDVEEEQRSNLKDYVDAATSTESLPYIGLLSEIDVDDIIVFPEAEFDLVSDYSSEENYIEMVDDGTSTDWLDGIETGTQTFNPSGTSTPVSEEQTMFTKNIGVNTHSKLTFEKETCTPIRHLFSKGTMTFYVSRTDKSTSTVHPSKYITETAAKFGGRVTRDASLNKLSVSDKVTMTSKAEVTDAAVETDPTLLDGKISECISKLRNVSDRLNSPTMRLSSDTEAFFGKGFIAKRHCSESSELTSSFVLSDSSSSLNIKSSPTEKSEEERQKQLQQLLAESSRKPKESKTPSKKEPKSKSKEQTTPVTKDSTSSSKSQEKLNIPTTPNAAPRSPTPIKSILKTSAKVTPQRETVSSPPTPVLRPRNASSNTPEKTTKTNDIDTSKYALQPTKSDQLQTNTSKDIDKLLPPPSIDPSVSPVTMRKTQRKPQPITTLKGKKNEDFNTYKSRSLPRQFSTENSPLSALMIPTSPPSRLPLLRYNSAPGRIATVPTHTLLKKAGQSPPMKPSTPRQTSPSKIPVSNKQTSPEKPAPELFSGQKSHKPHSRSPLPAISETRTPSSCSDSSEVSFLSVTSGDSMTLSLTPSIGTVSSETSEKCIDLSSKTNDSTQENYPQASGSGDKNTQKREKTGFMQRLFSKKKKESEIKPEIMHTNVKWTPPPKPPQEPPKVQIPPKSRPFVYVRSRIFSIQHDVEDEKKYLKEKEEEEKRLKEEERLKEAERKRDEEKKMKKEEKKSKAKSKQKKDKPPASPLLKPGKKSKKSSSRETDSDLSDCALGATSTDSADVFKM